MPAGAAVDGGGAWAEVAVSAGTDAMPLSVLSAISCVSVSACTAVGAVVSTSLSPARDALAVTWNGHVWTSVPTPAVGTNAQLFGVSCTSTNFCVGVGTDDAGARIEQWDGTTWSIAAVPASAGAQLSGVSCASPAFCVATGSTGTSASSAALIEQWDGTSWSVATTPAGTSTSLTGVSCPSTSFCVAVGGQDAVADQTLVEQWDGTSWSTVPSPNPGTASNALSGVSCIGPSFCAAVGYQMTGSPFVQSDQRSLAELWDGHTWRAASPGDPAGSGLGSVSCTSSSACTAVGGVVQSGNTEVQLVDSWNGSAWSPQPVPGDQTFTGLNGVACTAPSACTAVGAVSAYANPP